MIRGAYHYTEEGPLARAENFIKVVGNDGKRPDPFAKADWKFPGIGGVLRPILDLERMWVETKGGPTTPFPKYLERAQKWIAKVKAAFNVNPIIEKNVDFVVCRGGMTKLQSLVVAPP